MTETSDAREADESESDHQNNAPLRISNSNTGRNKWVSREQFIRLLLAHHRLVRCDDLELGRRGLMDPKTGDCFFIGEDDLLKPQSA